MITRSASRVTPYELSSLSHFEKQKIIKRAELEVDVVKDRVLYVINDVRKRGDTALLDHMAPLTLVRMKSNQIRVSPAEVEAAYRRIAKDLVQAIRSAAKNIVKYHKAQLPPAIWVTNVAEGIQAGRISRPISSVGAYIWGSENPYPSTVLMTVIPAKVAGVKKVVATVPPRPNGDIDPSVLVAADVAGVNEIYRITGPAAVAALAFGTETVPKVEKIVGRGDILATAAKTLLEAEVGIDFPSGPPELMVLADDGAIADFIVADFHCQAEHDPSTALTLVTTSKKLALEVSELISSTLGRKHIKENVRQALTRYSAILIAKNIAEAVSFVNEYAPEKLEVMTRHPFSLIESINNVGSIYIGAFSPVAAGDYGVGPSHVNPTNQLARIRAGLSVDDFIKRPSFQMLERNGLARVKGPIVRIVEAEGLHAHKSAILKRLED